MPSSGTLRLDAIGSTLTLYLNGTPVTSATDTTLTGPGSVGIIDAGGDSTFTNFLGYDFQTASLPFADTFTVPTSTPLGESWAGGTGSITSVNNAATVSSLDPSSTTALATVYGISASNVNVQADVNVSSSGMEGGVVLRETDIDDFYYAALYNKVAPWKQSWVTV